MDVENRRKEYWSKTLTITGILLVVWFLATFGIGYFARDLSFNFFGWPFSFYMGAQGSLVIYCLIIAFYASYMNKLDKKYGVDEGDEE